MNNAVALYNNYFDSYKKNFNETFNQTLNLPFKKTTLNEIKAYDS